MAPPEGPVRVLNLVPTMDRWLADLESAEDPTFQSMGLSAQEIRVIRDTLASTSSLAVELAEALEKIANGEAVLEPTGAMADLYGAKDGPQKAAYVRMLEHHEIADRALSKAREAGLLGE